MKRCHIMQDGRIRVNSIDIPIVVLGPATLVFERLGHGGRRLSGAR